MLVFKDGTNRASPLDAPTKTFTQLLAFYIDAFGKGKHRHSDHVSLLGRTSKNMQQHVIDQDLTTQPVQADIPSKRHKSITSGAPSRVRLEK